MRASASRSSRPVASRSGSLRSSIPLATDSLSPLRRGSTCRWIWNTVWKAAAPSLSPRWAASANSVMRTARATRCPMVIMSASVSGGVSVTSTVCRLGITSVWPLVKGRISRIARYASSSQIRMAGASPATIAQNTQDMPPRYWPSGGVRRPVGDRAAGRPGYAAAVDASDIAFAGAAAQARMLADGELSAPELLEIYLDRIARLDSRLRCYRVVLTDSARHEAAVAQDRLDAGERLPLLGVPIAIKDDVDVADEVTAYGSGGHGPAVTADAEVVRRLRAAGAVVIGKTNV